MSAIIKPTNLLKSYTGGNTSLVVEVTGKNLKDYLVALKIPPELVALVVVNNMAKDKEYIVEENDVIQLIPLVGGG